MSEKTNNSIHGLNISNVNQNVPVQKNCPFRVKLLIIIGIVIVLVTLTLVLVLVLTRKNKKNDIIIQKIPKSNETLTTDIIYNTYSITNNIIETTIESRSISSIKTPENTNTNKTAP